MSKAASMVRAGLALATAAMVLVPGPAAADPPADPGHQGRAHRAERPEIVSSTVRGSDTRGADRLRVDELLEARARAGEEVLLEDVDFVEVDTPQGAMGALVRRGERVEHLERVEHEGDTWLHAVVVAEEDGDAPDAQGSEAISGYRRADRRGHGCRDLWFEPSYSHRSDHKIYDCWEKYQSEINGRDWAYNRYTLFNSGDGRYIRNEMVDATVRSRPWAGRESRISQGPYTYAPRASETCTTYTATIGMDTKGGPGASVNVPISNCGPEYTPLPNGSQRSMGLDWTGRTQASRNLDVSWEFVTPSSGTNPMYADYVWMEVRYCHDPSRCYNGVDPSQYLTWRDSGW